MDFTGWMTRIQSKPHLQSSDTDGWRHTRHTTHIQQGCLGLAHLLGMRDCFQIIGRFICLLKILLQDTLEIPKHLKKEIHCFGRQIYQQVTALQIGVRAKEVEKYCGGIYKMEWVLALSCGTLKLPRGLYIYIYIYIYI